jgi:hypothetical protein
LVNGSEQVGRGQGVTRYMHEEDSKRKGKARASDEKSPIVKRGIEDLVSIKTTMPLQLWATPYPSLHSTGVLL